MYNAPQHRAIREPSEWKVVPDYPDYQVSDTGVLRSYKRPQKDRPFKVLNGSATPEGYIQYKLIGDEPKDFRQVYAQELVLEMWVGERPVGRWASHIDNDNGNNAVENLEWVLPIIANRDRVLPLGSDRALAKLTEKQVREVRLKKKAGVTYPQLAKEYGMAKHVLWKICVGRTWKHVDMEGLEVK